MIKHNVEVKSNLHTTYSQETMFISGFENQIVSTIPAEQHTKYRAIQALSQDFEGESASDHHRQTAQSIITL